MSLQVEMKDLISESENFVGFGSGFGGGGGGTTTFSSTITGVSSRLSSG